MARYLSPAWFEDVERQRPAATAGAPVLCLEQVVTDTPEGVGGPDGVVRYLVCVGPGGAVIDATADRGDGRAPLVTFTTDYATAADIASGAVSMQAALGAGRMRVGGDLAALTANQEVFRGVDPVPPAVRASTSWGPTGG